MHSSCSFFFLSFHDAHYSSMHYFSCVRQCCVQMLSADMLPIELSRKFVKCVLFSVPIESPLHHTYRLTGRAVLRNFDISNIWRNLSQCSKHNSQIERKRNVIQLRTAPRYKETRVGFLCNFALLPNEGQFLLFVHLADFRRTGELSVTCSIKHFIFRLKFLAYCFLSFFGNALSRDFTFPKR